MFANLIEDINDGAADHDYDLRKTGDNMSVRKDITADLDKPGLITISHQTVGSGDKQVQNTLLRFDLTVERSEDQVQAPMSWHLVGRVPTKVATAAQAEALLNQLISFLGKTDAKSMLIGGHI
jgi:hypothetical protein